MKPVLGGFDFLNSFESRSLTYWRMPDSLYLPDRAIL